MDFDALTTFDEFAADGGIALVGAVLSTWRERRHGQRTGLDRASLVSRGLLSAMFSMLAIILLATAAKLHFTAVR